MKFNYDEIYSYDFGTSSSTAAGIWHGRPMVIRNDEGEYTTPTALVLKEPRGRSIYGKAALKENEIEAVIESPKSYIGQQMACTTEDMKFEVEDAVKTFTNCFLKDLETEIEQPISKVVVTYPAYYDVIQRELFKTYVESGTREVVDMFPEPVAAAVSYILEMDDDSEHMILVNDIGGGTHDLAIIHVRKGKGERFEITVKYAFGQKTGGDDWDKLLMDHFLGMLHQKGIDYKNDVKLLKLLKRKCEQIKIEMAINSDNKYEFFVYSNVHKKMVELSLTRDEYQGIYHKFLKKVETTQDEFALLTSGLPVDTVLLVGGTCANDILGEDLKKYYQRGNYQDVTVLRFKPKESVAIGAALLAHMKYGFGSTKDQIIVKEDQRVRSCENKVSLITNDSLGIKCKLLNNENLISNIIPKGTTFPVKVKKTGFCVEKDGQDYANIAVYTNKSTLRKSKVEESKLAGNLRLDLRDLHVKRYDPIEITMIMEKETDVRVEASVNGKAVNQAVLELNVS